MKEEVKKFTRNFINKVIYYKNKNFRKKFLEKHAPVLNKKVIFANLSGHTLHINVEGVWANALRLRGCDVGFLICDGICEACSRRDYYESDSVEKWKNLCEDCSPQMVKKLEYYDIKPIFASKYISEEKKQEFREFSEKINIEEIYDYTKEGLNIGQVAWQSFIRYQRGLVIDPYKIDQTLIPMYRKYFYASLIVDEITKNLIAKEKPDNIFISHALFSDFAPVVKVAKKLGIKAVAWISTLENFSFNFFANMTAENTNLLSMKESNWKQLRDKNLTPDEDKAILEYFNQRYADDSDISLQVFDKAINSENLKIKLGFNNNKKTVCLFCHINWDAAVDLNSLYFNTVDEWVIESINHMIKNDKVNWIIRIHPAEIIYGKYCTAYDIIDRHFDVSHLPEHIKIISHTEKINSKNIFEIIDCGITMFGSIGMELPCLGKNVVIAGMPHYASKGFTIDTKSKKEYFNILDNIQSLPELSHKQIELAKKYAFSFFVQRGIPLDFLFDKTKNKTWKVNDMEISKLTELLPNKNRIIDTICNGIINEDDVILDIQVINNYKMKGGK